MNEKQKLLSHLPSVDKIMKSEQGEQWLKIYPRAYVLQAIREVIDLRRRDLIEGHTPNLSEEYMIAEIESKLDSLTSYSLKPLINATGVVIHTNLGRSILSEKALEHIRQVSESYSNLE
ncbi:MAG: L-seryl-tRNA(Sec) selenium transferase, partial [Nitrospirae bacterium]|nr:L-seryl-tRNA(Sec) selenium transferase [Nitrospirota bacterium]